MQVKILDFGSNWWGRYGADATDPYRFSRHAAYFNATGVRCGRKVRRHWIIPGLIRFNGIGDFNPQFPLRAIGQTFCCSELAFACGGNRVLFKHKLRPVAATDSYLVVVNSARFGQIDFGLDQWKSECVRAIAVSRLRDQHEAMLLMKPGDWISTHLGFWQLRAGSNFLHGAGLELTQEDLG